MVKFPVKFQVFNGLLFINDHTQGIDTDLYVFVYKTLGDHGITLLCLYTFRNHGLVGNQQ